MITLLEELNSNSYGIYISSAKLFALFSELVNLTEIFPIGK